MIGKIKEKLKKYKLQIIFIICYFLISVLIHFIINYIYSIPAPLDLFESKTGASSTLSYAGSILTGFGTILLAMVTFVVTRKDSAKNMDRPFFVIEKVDDSEFDKSDYRVFIDSEDKYTYVTLKNIGKGAAINTLIENNNETNKNEDTIDKLEILYNTDHRKSNLNYIECGESIVFRVNLDELTKSFEVVYYNVQGCIYKQIIQYWKKDKYGHIVLEIEQTSMAVLGIDY